MPTGPVVAHLFGGEPNVFLLESKACYTEGILSWYFESGQTLMGWEVIYPKRNPLFFCKMGTVSSAFRRSDDNQASGILGLLSKI